MVYKAHWLQKVAWDDDVQKFSSADESVVTVELLVSVTVLNKYLLWLKYNNVCAIPNIFIS